MLQPPHVYIFYYLGDSSSIVENLNRHLIESAPLVADELNIRLSGNHETSQLHLFLADRQKPYAALFGIRQFRKMMSPTVYTMKPDDDTAFPTCSKKHSKKEECDGMVTERKRTDILCLKLIVCMWIAMSVVGSIALKHGNPYRLIAPTDDNGSLCGISADVKSKPYFYTITATGSESMIFGAPYSFDSIFVTIVLTTSKFKCKTGSGVCLETCPTASALPTSQIADDYICLDWVGGKSDL